MVQRRHWPQQTHNLEKVFPQLYRPLLQSLSYQRRQSNGPGHPSFPGVGHQKSSGLPPQSNLKFYDTLDPRKSCVMSEFTIYFVVQFHCNNTTKLWVLPFRLVLTSIHNCIFLYKFNSISFCSFYVSTDCILFCNCNQYVRIQVKYNNSFWRTLLINY